MANGSTTGFASGLAALAGGPVAGIGLPALGAFQGLLQANTMRDLQSQAKKIGSHGYFNELLAEITRNEGGRFNAIRRAVEMRGDEGADRTRAAFRRSGLSGVGEAVANTADIRSFIAGREATGALRNELYTRARTQQQRELAAIRRLMQTPHGNVSPVSAAIAGAGSGLEAFVEAKRAEQFRGGADND